MDRWVELQGAHGVKDVVVSGETRALETIFLQGQGALCENAVKSKISHRMLRMEEGFLCGRSEQ